MVHARNDLRRKQSTEAFGISRLPWSDSSSVQGQMGQCQLLNSIVCAAQFVPDRGAKQCGKYLGGTAGKTIRWISVQRSWRGRRISWTKPAQWLSAPPGPEELRPPARIITTLVCRWKSFWDWIFDVPENPQLPQALPPSSPSVPSICPCQLLVPFVPLRPVQRPLFFCHAFLCLCWIFFFFSPLPGFSAFVQRLFPSVSPFYHPVFIVFRPHKMSISMLIAVHQQMCTVYVDRRKFRSQTSDNMDR